MSVDYVCRCHCDHSKRGEQVEENVERVEVYMFQ